MKHLRKNFLKYYISMFLLKNKFIRGNHVPYMTKNLRKAFIKCSQLENKNISNSTVKNKNKYKKYKNFFW